MTVDYIVLTDSASARTKRFKALQVRPTLLRTDGLKYLLDGTIDKTAGAILRMWQYQLRVPYSVTDTNYGTMSDLEYFFKLNDPNGTPNDLVVLTDHYGDNHNVYFLGELTPENLITVLDGVNSRYVVTIALQQKEPVSV